MSSIPETTTPSDEVLAKAQSRFQSYQTRSGLLRFLVTNPGMIGQAVKTALHGAKDALKEDQAIHYRMQLKALHAVAPNARLGHNIWSELDTFVKLCASVAKPTDRCLEIGAGGGRLTARLAPLVRTLTAQDVSDHLFDEVRRVTQGLGRIDFMVADGFGDNLPDSAYDVVACTDVITLLFFEEVIQYARNVYRTLVPGGHFVVSMKTIDDKDEIERYLNFFDTQFPQKVHRLPTALYVRMFERQGFLLKSQARNTPEEERGLHNGLHLNLLLQKPAAA